MINLALTRDEAIKLACEMVEGMEEDVKCWQDRVIRQAGLLEEAAQKRNMNEVIEMAHAILESAYTARAADLKYTSVQYMVDAIKSAKP